jgi:uncharacterized OB-fold protein
VIYHKAWAPWLQLQVPYVVAQIELAEGPRLTTNLTGIDLAAVRIGLEVAAYFEPVTEEVTLVQFSPI